MQFAKITKEKAESLKHFLHIHHLLSAQTHVCSDADFVYFPLVAASPLIRKQFPTVAFVRKNVVVNERITHYHQLLTSLSRKEQALLPSSYDLLGTIAIIEIPVELVKRQTMIAKALMRANSRIKTVLKKKSVFGGKYRTRKYTHLAGIRTKVAEYRENGCVLMLDVEKVYFSPRLSEERQRIFRQVKQGEDILVLFSGCGPYTVVLSKNTNARKIVGVELNPVAHRYALQNVEKNHCANVTCLKQDASILLRDPKTKKILQFDRILMPLPKSADDFLDTALHYCKNGTILHFYDFQKEGEFDLASDKIIAKAKTYKLRVQILRIVRCGQYGPQIYRICVDAQIWKDK